jgi:hypothetical protein
MLIVFGIFAGLMLAASFRTSIATVVGVSVLTATLFELAAANYTGSALTCAQRTRGSGLIRRVRPGRRRDFQGLVGVDPVTKVGPVPMDLGRVQAVHE